MTMLLTMRCARLPCVFSSVLPPVFAETLLPETWPAVLTSPALASTAAPPAWSLPSALIV
ncbi:hypothetical protein [Variovorax sp. DT-64]|uniref:hypothetical protein n=1 Tax=Variovorax sp. DT-64 TaxID=3396160 RepID=UPI003F1D1BA3